MFGRLEGRILRAMKWRLLFLVLTLLFTSTGCAFAGIGAGVGSAFPKTERAAEPKADTLVVGSEDSNGLVLLPQHDVVHVADEHVTNVRPRKGSHWLEGFLVGGAIDLVAGGVLAYFAVHSLGSSLSAMGAM
jgi:hypothetical protein